jgi:hypothetical protein
MRADVLTVSELSLARTSHSTLNSRLDAANGMSCLLLKGRNPEFKQTTRLCVATYLQYQAQRIADAPDEPSSDLLHLKTRVPPIPTAR